MSADLDEMENAYVAAVMRALVKWQESGAEALQAMHTADAKEWDRALYKTYSSYSGISQ